MATQWYAAIDGDPKGPLTLSELKGWVWQGKVDAETFVRQGAGGEWAAAGTIAELFPDGSHATPPDPAATLEPYTETHAIERLNRRIAAVFSLLAVLCGLAGAIMVVIFLVLNSYSWVAAASFLLYLLAWTVPGGALGAMVGYLKRAPGVGAMLGGLFGPFGVVAALALDNRPYCSNCSGPLEDMAKACPHCHAVLYDPLTEEEPDPRGDEEAEPRGEESHEIRTWTDSGGQYSMRGRFIRLQGGMVTLRHEDGTEVDVPMDRLSTADRQWIRSAPRGTQPAAGVLSAILIQE